MERDSSEPVIERLRSDLVSETSLVANELFGSGAAQRGAHANAELRERLNLGREKKKRWWKDHDNLERLRVFIAFCLEIYRIMMGTFLSLFVPHR